MTTAIERGKDRIRTLTRLLHQAGKPIRGLRTIDWAPEVQAAFLASGCRELPPVTYPPGDPGPTIMAAGANTGSAPSLTLPTPDNDHPEASDEQE